MENGAPTLHRDNKRVRSVLSSERQDGPNGINRVQIVPVGSLRLGRLQPRSYARCRTDNSAHNISIDGLSASGEGMAYLCPVIDNGVWFKSRPTISSSTPASMATVANVRLCVCGLHFIFSGPVMCPVTDFGDGNTHLGLSGRKGARIS